MFYIYRVPSFTQTEICPFMTADFLGCALYQKEAMRMIHTPLSQLQLVRHEKDRYIMMERKNNVMGTMIIEPITTYVFCQSEEACLKFEQRILRNILRHKKYIKNYIHMKDIIEQYQTNLEKQKQKRMKCIKFVSK